MHTMSKSLSITVALLASSIATLVQAQGIRRLDFPYSGIGRRAVNCTGCNFCASALKLEWVLVPEFKVQTLVEVSEVYDPETGETNKTTVTVSLDELGSKQTSLLDSIAAEGTQTTSPRDVGIQVAFPTPYLLYQPSYVWEGQVESDGQCIKVAATAEKAPVRPTPLVDQARPSVVAPGVTDSLGVYYTLRGVKTDAPAAQQGDDAPLKSCHSNCQYTGYESLQSAQTTYNIVGPTPQLSVAFVTACSRSTIGAGTTEKCEAVLPASPVGPTPAPNSGGGSGGSGGSGGGGSGGGGGGQVTTTDSAGNPVIVAAPTAAGGGGSGNANNNGGGGAAPTAAGGNLHATTNAQGAVIIATGGSGNADAVAGGQITLTNAAGETVVVQGASLVPTGQAAVNAEVLTVTNEAGELVVVQGGTTGTLSVGQDGGTVLIAATVTQTSWTAGATISAAGATTSADPTAVQNVGTVRKPPYELLVPGVVLSTVLLLCLLL